jgi:ribosomal protein L29
MKKNAYFAELLGKSEKELSQDLLQLLKQRTAFRLSKSDQQSRVAPHVVRLVRKNIARLKLVIAQRQKEK